MGASRSTFAARLPRRSLLTGLGALGAGCGANQGGRPENPRSSVAFPVHDATPAFFAFAERARGLPPPEAVRLFRSQVIAAHPQLYTAGVLGVKDTGDALDARVAEWIPRVLALVPAMREARASFGPAVDAAAGRFRASLPDFRWEHGCHLFASIDAMNGAVRTVDGRPALIFGLDVIAKDTGGSMPPPVLFAHELFHVYHQEALGGVELEPRLYVALWAEGLAAHASLALTPGATDPQALPLSHLHDPAAPSFDRADRRVSLAEVMPLHARALGAELRARLDSTEQADYAAFFLGRASERLGERPVRSAYWFGLAVVRRLAAGRTLAQLARLDPRALRAQIAEALDSVIA